MKSKDYKTINRVFFNYLANNIYCSDIPNVVYVTGSEFTCNRDGNYFLHKICTAILNNFILLFVYK